MGKRQVRVGLPAALVLALGARALWAQAIHTPHDHIPDFGATSTIVSASSGAWSSAATWTPARLPASGDVVAVATGHTVTYDVSSTARIHTVAIRSGGTLRFRTDLSTRLLVGNLEVLGGGALEIGTSAGPVAPGVTAEITILDQPLDGVADPDQFGTGLVSGGKVTIHGAAKSPTFVRLAAEARAGDSTLSLSQPVTGWRAGDRLIVPDSKQWARQTMGYVPEWEVGTLSAVSADGRTLTLSAPLAYNHPGARNGDGVLEFLPHVGNLTRNVRVRSENPNGTRGHVLFTHRAEVDVRYGEFSALGRTTLDSTSRKGRYYLHLHHVMGPVSPPASGPQFTLLGNAVVDDLAQNRHKWGITLHDSHYGRVAENVIYNTAGAGIVAEDGPESFNRIEGNFAVRIPGEGDRAGSGQPGNEGMGFWFRGPNNTVRDNVAANAVGNSVEAAYGYKYFQVYLGNVSIPNFQGADTSIAGQFTVRNGNAMPILEFARNEVYGTENGLTLWWINHGVDVVPSGLSVVKDFRSWHIAGVCFYGYPMADVTFDGFVIRGDRTVMSNWHESVIGIWFGDYETENAVIRNADIQGVRTGIVDPYFGGSTTIIENSYLRNSTDISVQTIGAPGSGPNGASRSPKSLIVRNVRFGSVAGWNLGGRTPYTLSMGYNLHNDSANLVKSDTVYVYDYNGVAGDNFQLYYPEQAPGFIVPQSSGNLAGSPAAGLTNQQNWATYGIAIAGAVSPTGATRPEIEGFVSPLTSSAPPTITSHPGDRTVNAGQSATFSVGVAGTPPFSYQWQRNGANISGATGPSYTIPPATAADDGATFRVVATNGLGSVTSNGAVLTVNSSSSDTDGDGLPDAWETQHFGNLSATAGGDPDSDGLTNLQELGSGTNPRQADTDGDGLTDAQEVNTHGTNPTAADSDGDGMSDGSEAGFGFDPLDGDQDRNGVLDGQDDWDADGILNVNDPTPGTPQAPAVPAGSSGGSGSCGALGLDALLLLGLLARRSGDRS